MEESRIEKLERLIKKSEEKIKECNFRLNQINEGIKSAQEQLSANKIIETRFPKILTQKQMNELKRIKEKEFNEAKIQERKNIDQETKSALERAEIIRKNSFRSGEQNQKKAELEALKLEVRAYEKVTRIRSEIFHEKELSMEDVLAKKAVKESELVGYKKNLVLAQIKKPRDENLISNLRDKINFCQSRKNHYADIYTRYCKEFEESKLKYAKCERRLRECHEKLKAVYEV